MKKSPGTALLATLAALKSQRRQKVATPGNLMKQTHRNFVSPPQPRRE